VYAKALGCVGFFNIATRERSIHNIFLAHVFLCPAKPNLILLVGQDLNSVQASRGITSTRQHWLCYTFPFSPILGDAESLFFYIVRSGDYLIV